MTAYAPISVSRGAGADLTATPLVAVASTGDTFPPGPDNFLRVKNAGGTVCTVSVIDAATVAGPSGTFLAPLTLAPAVPITTGDRLFGPFPATAFAAPSDGQVHVAYSFITTVTAGCYTTPSG